MPNIVEQHVSSERLFIRVSNGRTVEVSPARFKQEFDRLTGTRTRKRADALAWLKQHIVDTLGAEMVDAAALDLNFDDATGRVTQSDWRSDR